MTRLTIVLVALSLGVASGSAQAQGPTLEQRLDPRTHAAVQRVVDSASAAGLPTEPLILKALEGASKGADGARIAHAVRRLAGSLFEARAALGPTSTPVEIGTGASALQAGVPEASLRETRAARQTAPVTVALSVLTDLVVAGVPADVARDAVVSLARAGASDDALLSFLQQVQRDIGAGTAPGIAAAGARSVFTAPAPLGPPAPAARRPVVRPQSVPLTP